MTRQEKLDKIELYRPSLYSKLSRVVPKLIQDPNSAPQHEISIYNTLISEEAQKENNPAFKNNFSF